ncbi:MAG: 3-(cis-5,6-dihydroxycyclohexa-1,3-dien-1-yl)propanoate dehydrogenase [Proteobacteria bacterium]|nr:3-(cis-5,6-dihydroxycyclohexa-1,3-dien-1-yl)propanoate dehydrogenase [Pseudomonadota bacterium]
MGWLKDTVALVTGGGNGIGLAVARRFLAEGARVAVLDRDVSAIERLNESAREPILAVRGDVLSIEDGERALHEVSAAYGRLDVFVGNAGIFDFFRPFESLDCRQLAAGFDEIFGVNVKAYLLGARIVASALRATRGSMIFTVSNSGFYAGGGGALYVSSKHAVVGLIRQLAFELAPDVRVNGVAPGGTLTGLSGAGSLDLAGHELRDQPDIAAAVAKHVPLGFMADPEDHTGHYVLLASKVNSRATTGAILMSDGGMEVRGGGRRRGGQMHG